MTEILFFHMTETTLEKTLPNLLEKSLAKGWKCVVQSGAEENISKISANLWTWKADSFLPHSADPKMNPTDQPIWLTSETGNPNGAHVRFMVEGAEPPDLQGYERGVYIFDGHEEQSIAHARTRWKIEKDAGHDVTYWQQNAQGGWDKKA